MSSKLDSNKYFSYFTFNARELMKALLNRQPAMRLGAGQRDFLDIQVRKENLF